MTLRFIGTRGEIEARTRRHRWHTALLVLHGRQRVMIDCGADWRGRFRRLTPQAIVLTHAHPDHALGLQDGADCPVFATPETWRLIRSYPIESRRVVRPRRRFRVGRLAFEAFQVEHSIRCPAVGYRVSAAGKTFFYAPDLVYIHARDAALDGVDLYIGDGATLSRPLVRRRGHRLIGHAPVRTQLTWCHASGVRAAIITHCGTQIVTGDPRQIRARVVGWAKEREVHLRIAYDGLSIAL